VSSERARPAKVVFACVQGAGRSQMAAAFFDALSEPALVRALAAGTRPADRVHPEVVRAMNESGIDLSRVKPELLTAELAEGASWLITLGCGEECPVVPGAKREDWALPDPRGQELKEVRNLRDELRRRVSELILREGWGNRSLVDPEKRG
jgi:arsenate reductase (thioredoxin)